MEPTAIFGLCMSLLGLTGLMARRFLARTGARLSSAVFPHRDAAKYERFQLINILVLGVVFLSIGLAFMIWSFAGGAPSGT